MGKIIILDENTSNKIAAGEVVEKPSSVVKELVENSLDAGASAITIEIKNGGITYIKVMDNGSGMEEDDVGIAFERHSTSKIRSADDIESISSMGFRGEALASIAAVSAVQLVTRTKAKENGTSIEIHGGNIIEIKPVGCPVGTTINVKNLFYNTPARFKFLKKDTTEAGYVSDVISRIALGNPNISFKLISNNSTVLHTPGNNDYLSAIFSVYGKDTAKDVYEVMYEDARIRITGYVGKPEIARSNRNQQTIFINRRLIRSKMIASAIDEAYSTFLMKNKFAFCVMNLEINPVYVDVNVHPSKMEVKFSNEQEIFRAVYNAVQNALLSHSQIRTIQPSTGKNNPFAFEKIKKEEYNQQKISYEKATPANSASYIRETHSIDKPYNSTVGINETNKYAAAIDKIETSAINTENSSGVSEVNIKKPIESTDYTNYIPLEIKKVDIPVAPMAGNKTYTADEVPKESKITDPVKDSMTNLKDARIIGQAFNTYILLQMEEQLILIDQHAAHERILYEDIKKKYDSREPLSQTLLSTFVLELTYREIKFLEEEKSFFGSLGFDYDSFGSNSVILRSAPFNVQERVKEIFLELLDYFMNAGRTDKSMITDEALYRIACKAAIKANKKLDDKEILSLLEKLSMLINPYTCPHGRPSAIKLSKYELEKMFKRIV